MASVSLYDYLESINQLLDEDRYVEAERHCRHILAQYPRHIETYRLLAKAFLARLQYTAAIDLLQRALSADPNDFITHIALSDAYRGDGRSDLALRHLERAFELSPYNGAIQDELRRIYGEAGQVSLVTERLPLTPVAAAHLNLRSELYQPAIVILRQIVHEAPERVEVELMLAEALWRSGNRVEAASMCMRILDVLPDSIVANAILSEVWQGSARMADAVPYLRRLHSMTLMDRQHVDVETVVGAALTTHGATLLPDELTIEPLDISGEEHLPAESDSRWMEKSPLPAAEAEFVEIDEDMYGWLSGVTEAASDTSAATPSAATPSAEAGQDKPETDWFADPSLQEKDAGDDPSQSVADWLDDEWQTPDAQQPSAEEDYLNAPLPSLTASDAGLEPFVGGDADDAFPDIEDPEIPSWLAAGIESEGAVESKPVEIPSDDAMPDWLAAITSTDFDAVQLDPTSASQWLSDEEAAVEADETSEASAEAADWLASLSGHVDEIQEPEAEAAVLESDWLSVDREPQAAVEWLNEEPDDAVEEDSAADWLTEMAGDDDEAVWGEDWLQEETAVAPVEEERTAASETDWLAKLSQETEEAADAGDWLAELAMNTAEDSVEDSVDMDEQDSVSTPFSEEDAPVASEQDWLQQLDEEEDEAWLAELSTGVTDELAHEVAAWSEDPLTPTNEAADDGLFDLAGGSTDEMAAGDAAVLDSESSEADSDDLEDWLADLSRPTGELSDLDSFEIDEPFAASDEAAEAAELTKASGEEASDFVPDWLPGEMDEYQNVEAEQMGVHDEKDVPEQKKTPEPDKERAKQEREDSDWLDDLTLSEEVDEAEEAFIGEGDVPAELAKEDLPDWLNESTFSLSEEVGEESEVPDWLLESTSDLLEVSKSLQPIADEPSIDAQEEQELAEWLSEDWAPDVESVSAEKEDALSLQDELEPSATSPSSLLEDLTVDEGALPEDDDLAWLGQLAGEDVAEEAMPALDWLSDMGDLADDPQEVEVEEEADTAVSPVGSLESAEADDDFTDDEEDYEDEDELFAVPADLDDAMSWLEDLAAEQDAPIEPLPTVAEVLDDEPETTETESDTVPPDERVVAEDAAFAAASAASFDEAMVDLDDTLSWLDDLTTEADALDEASHDLLAEEPEGFDVFEADAPGEQREMITDAEPTPDMVTDVPEDLEEAMAWLESLAARQGAPLDELPSLSQQEAPVDLVEDDEGADLFDETFGDEALPAPPLSAVDDSSDVATELDEAIDWLDDLAAGETTLDEWDVGLEPDEDVEMAETAVTPAETDDSLTTEVAGASEIDEALFEALDWLEAVTFDESIPEDAAEQLSFEQTSDDELNDALERLALMALPDKMVDEAPAVEPTAVEEAEPKTAVDAALPPATIKTDDFDDLEAVFNIPDDPDEAMAWLQEFAAEDLDDRQPQESNSAAAEEETAETADNANVEAVEDFLADVPDDPDEAMAWLEQLAARQGASLDELPTVTDAAQDVEMPQWVAAAAEAAAADEAARDAAIEEAESGFDPDSLIDEDDDFEEKFDFALSDDEEEAPDWLGMDAPGDASADEQIEQSGWLDSLPGMDVTGWLESEEAASVATGGDTGPLPQTGPLFEEKPVTGPLTEPEATDQPEDAPADLPVTSIFQVDEDQLEQARAALAAGASRDAVAAYQQMVAKGEGLMTLIGELETAAAQHQREPAFRRLLGDAYMRNGQLQKALLTYRDALDRL